MLIRLSVFAVWALVGATAVGWGLRLLVTPAGLPPHAAVAFDPSSAGGDLRRLLGEPTPAGTVAAAPAPEIASRFQLTGVMASRAAPSKANDVSAGQGGWALISVDGRPSRPYRVGARVSQELMLKSVGVRTATLAPFPVQDNGAVVMLELPALPSSGGTGSDNRAGSGSGVRPFIPVPPARAFNPEQAPPDAPEAVPSPEAPPEMAPEMQRSRPAL